MALGFERPVLGTTDSTLFATVTRFFDQRHWRYERMEGQSGLRTAFAGRHETWHCMVAVNEAEQQVAFFSMVAAAVVPEHRLAVAEIIARTNFGIGLGSFEIDFSDGEVRCKTCVSVADGELTQALLGNLVRCNTALVERHAARIRRVASGEQTPTQAMPSE